MLLNSTDDSNHWDFSSWTTVAMAMGGLVPLSETAPSLVAVGDCLYMAWGYDLTVARYRPGGYGWDMMTGVVEPLS
jgi:hypothetical protein